MATTTTVLEESERFEGLRQRDCGAGAWRWRSWPELRREHYGYTLRKALDDLGLEIDEGTLYPLLRRLESQGLLESEWRETDKRRKRFYKLSSSGERVLAMLVDEFVRLNAALARITQEA